MSRISPTSHSVWPHRLAVCLVGVVFPLIWVGGLVTTYDAGMAVPDWPSTYGYNLFLYPLSTWLAAPFDLFVEHGHRLLGAAAGLVTIALVVALFTGSSPTWLRWLGLNALALVIFQGVLGGLRVRLDARTLAMIHGCVGPAFFAFAAALAVCTTSTFLNVKSVASERAVGLRSLAVVTSILALLQIVLGAQVRHVPVTASAEWFRAAVVFHVFMGVVLAFHAWRLTWRLARWPQAEATALQPARFWSWTASLLIVFQLLLGTASWMAKYAWPGAEYSGQAIVNNSLTQALTLTAHVACGSLILASLVMTTLWSWRTLAPATARLVQQPSESNGDTAPVRLEWGVAL